MVDERPLTKKEGTSTKLVVRRSPESWSRISVFFFLKSNGCIAVKKSNAVILETNWSHWVSYFWVAQGGIWPLRYKGKIKNFTENGFNYLNYNNFYWMWRDIYDISVSVLRWSHSYENRFFASRSRHRNLFCENSFWNNQWRNYENNDFLQRCFSRILTTKCELKLDCKECLVFYRYSTLCAWHLNLLCHFQRKLHQRFT